MRRLRSGFTRALRGQRLPARLATALKISVSAPPLEDRANVAVVEFFSGIFSVPRAAVQVVAGDRSRNKVIRIAGRSAAELQQMLREHFTV